jgi:hypothetical protein
MSTTAIPSNGKTFTPTSELNALYADIGITAAERDHQGGGGLAAQQGA